MYIALDKWGIHFVQFHSKLNNSDATCKREYNEYDYYVSELHNIVVYILFLFASAFSVLVI